MDNEAEIVERRSGCVVLVVSGLLSGPRSFTFSLQYLIGHER